MDRVERFDFLRLDSRPKRTSQGFLTVAARVSRTGVLEYHLGDGTVRRELRAPDEVFHQDSLASLEGAPVTVNHHGLVTSRNVAQFGVGHVRGAGQRDDHYVTATMAVERQDAVTKVEARDLVEVSAGYTCGFDMTPGEWHGQRYDCAQRGIRYNHVALGPAGWGRAGPDVRLRMDSAEAAAGAVSRTDATQLGLFLRQRFSLLNRPAMEVATAMGLNGPDDLEFFLSGFFGGEDPAMLAKAATLINVPVATLQALVPDNTAPVAARKDSGDTPPHKDRKTMKTTIKIGGVAFPVEIDDALAPTFTSAMDTVVQERQDAVDQVATLAGEKAALETANATLTTDLATANDPARLESAAADRATLVQDAKKIAPDLDASGMKDKDIKIAALVASGEDQARMDSADDGFLAGAFSMAVSKAAPKADDDAAPRSAGAAPPPAVKQDSADDDKSPAARHAAMRARGADAWKQPLTNKAQG